jgi:phenylacetate-CoA ligase
MFQTLSFLLLVNALNNLRKRRPEEMLQLQQVRLRQLLHHAAQHSSFYRSRFRGIDLDTCRLADLPTLTKDEMMARFDDVVTDRRVTRAGIEAFLADGGNLGKYYQGRYAVCHTSGSQGQPALVVQTRQDQMRGFAVQFARGHPLPKRITVLLARLWDPVRLAVVTQQPGFYPSGAAFTYLTNARLPFLRLLRLSVFDPVEQTVARLNTFRPQFLSGYTSSLEVLAHEENAGRLRLRGAGCLEQATNLSEALPPTSRAFIEAAFGVHVADNYSMAECMGLTSGCTARAGCHLNVDLACLEVVDGAGQPVPAGTAGSKVLLTNLYNRVQPLIRYEISDVVTLGESPCPCGSNLPHIASVAGRTKERLWIYARGAYREIPYYLFLAGLHHYLDLAEHQVVQTGRNRFVVRVAPLPGKTLSAERVRKLVYDSVRAEGLAGLVEIGAEIVDEIQPDPGSGKRHRVKNLVGPPPGGLREAAGPAARG